MISKARSLHQTQCGSLIVLGRTKTLAAIAAIALGLEILVCLVLIPTYGLVGAVAAVVVSYLATSLILVRIVHRVAGFVPLPGLPSNRA